MSGLQGPSYAASMSPSTAAPDHQAHRGAFEGCQASGSAAPSDFESAICLYPLKKNLGHFLKVGHFFRCGFMSGLQPGQLCWAVHCDAPGYPSSRMDLGRPLFEEAGVWNLLPLLHADSHRHPGPGCPQVLGISPWPSQGSLTPCTSRSVPWTSLLCCHRPCPLLKQSLPHVSLRLLSHPRGSRPSERREHEAFLTCV